MDINTRLDGFIVHPLDAFNDKHHEDNIPKFSNTAPNLDGFTRHPLDSFIIHEHDNGISNDFSNYNTANNYTNLDFYSNNKLYDIGNISSQYNTTNNIDIYQNSNLDFLFSGSSVNNDININQLLSGNVNSYESPISYNYNNSSIGTNYNYLGTSTPIETNYINTTSTQYYPNTTNYVKVLPTVYKKAITQNTSNYNPTPVTTNITIKSPTIIQHKTKMRRVNTLPTSSIVPFISGNYKRSGYAFKHFPSKIAYNSLNYNVSYNPLYKTAPYSVTTYEPEINWKRSMPSKTTIIIPTKRSVIIPRKTTIIVPKKQTIIVPKPVLIQKNNIAVPTIQVPVPQPTVPQVIPNTASYKILPGNILVPTLSVVNQTSNVSKIPIIQNPYEKVPMDRVRVIDTKIIPAPKMTSKIYFPKDSRKK